MKSLQGHLLVASSRLVDPNFYRTVVLLIQHESNGAFGVILNRPSRKLVRELWEEVCNEPCNNDDPTYVGGPVSGPILALHTDVVHSEDEVIPGLYLAADREQLQRLLCGSKDNHQVRLFMGYSGWGEGQLERELAEGSWHVVEASVEDVFVNDEFEDVWETMTTRIGRSILAPVLASVPVPDDPSWN